MPWLSLFQFLALFCCTNISISMNNGVSSTAFINLIRPASKKNIKFEAPFNPMIDRGTVVVMAFILRTKGCYRPIGGIKFFCSGAENLHLTFSHNNRR
jgi:hypothetical protein